MIAAAATAVGINMTFLMPYSLLHRGWSKPFRGLARFDLCTGMAIPYILVTSCVVIAAAYAFHAKADAEFLSTDPAVFQTSPTFPGAKSMLTARLEEGLDKAEFAKLTDEETGSHGAFFRRGKTHRVVAGEAQRLQSFEGAWRR